MADLIDTLNRQFSLAGHLWFHAGENGLPMAKIDNGLATAEVYLHGAHITAFQPKDSEPVLWVSPLALFQSDKAIRGGVPVIWPWFGPHATDISKPQHGFARTAEWRVNTTKALADGGTKLQLVLSDTRATRALWPHAFELNLAVTVGTELTIELTCRNTGEQAFTAGGALHSYFAVADVEQIFVEGLAGCKYIDQLDSNQRRQQAGDVRITQEVDRIYVDTEAACVIHDTHLSRKIHVKKTGSRSTVVWNPWQDKVRAMGDFPNEAYQQMLCIETANAVDDVRQLEPGEEHTFSQGIAVATDT